MSDRDIVKKQQEQEAENKLFCENLRLIIENSDTILKREEFFFCEFGSAFLSIAYIAKGGPIPLGVLISLWQRGEFIDKCSHCGGDVYIIGAGGSPLSGTHSFWGYCGQCGRKQSGKKPTLGELWQPVVEMLKRYPNKPIIEKGTRPVFSWREGLKGDYTPDRVIKDKVRGVSLQELVEKLRGGIL